MPRRKDEYASHVVVVPAHLLLAEKAHDLSLSSVLISQHKQVVSKCGDIVEDGFGIEEQLGKEREVLRVELHD